MMDNRSIGVFDSGLGGLTAVKQIMNELPNENIIYFGDTGRVPYGNKSRDTVTKYAKSDINFLLSKNVKIIVVACGTVSSQVLPVIKDGYDIPIIGVVEATADAAYKSVKNGKIGIIGTSGTIKSGAYESLLKKKNPDLQIFSNACPLFVPLVENGHFDTEVTKLVIEEYLADIKAAGVDTLILGCTHYPLLKKSIARYMGESVTLIDAGYEAAKALKRYFDKDDLHSEQQDECQYKYYVSDDVESFENIGGIFLQKHINGQVEKIEIEKY